MLVQVCRRNVCRRNVLSAKRLCSSLCMFTLQRASTTHTARLSSTMTWSSLSAEWTDHPPAASKDTLIVHPSRLEETSRSIEPVKLMSAAATDCAPCNKLGARHAAPVSSSLSSSSSSAETVDVYNYYATYAMHSVESRIIHISKLIKKIMP